MISLMETQKLSHCIGRTVVRLLREPRNLVEYSHRGSHRLICGTIIAFELQQLIWIKVLWAYPARSEANHRSYSLLFISSQLLPRIKRQDSAAFTSPNRDARQKCARLL